jgi:hypothetical protein
MGMGFGNVFVQIGNRDCPRIFGPYQEAGVLQPRHFQGFVSVFWRQSLQKPDEAAIEVLVLIYPYLSDTFHV